MLRGVVAAEAGMIGAEKAMQLSSVQSSETHDVRPIWPHIGRLHPAASARSATAWLLWSRRLTGGDQMRLAKVGARRATRGLAAAGVVGALGAHALCWNSLGGWAVAGL